MVCRVCQILGCRNAGWAVYEGTEYQKLIENFSQEVLEGRH